MSGPSGSRLEPRRLARGALRRARRVSDRVVLAAAPGLGAIESVATDRPCFALTFDDGPDPRYTRELLAVLDEHGAKATFFMLGEQAAAHRDVVAEVLGGGHCVANHGWDHSSLVAGAPEHGRRAWRRGQVLRAREVLGPEAAALFRPAYGDLDLAASMEVRRCGYEVVGWSVSARDWQSNDAEAFALTVVDALRPGAIVLFHDRLADAYDYQAFARDDMVKAVRLILESLDGRLRSVTVPELLEAGRPERRILRATPAAVTTRANPDLARTVVAPAARTDAGVDTDGYTGENLDTLVAFSRPDVVEVYTQRASELWPCEREMFDRYVEPGSRILDLGVGTGRTTEHLSALATHYVGLDFSAAMIEQCEERFPKVDFVVADASDLSIFDDRSFDVVVFSFNGIDCLHPDTARHRCIREMRRVLVPGGTAIVSEHNPAVVVSRPRPLAGVSPKLAAARLARAAQETVGNVRAIERRGTRWRADGYYFDPSHGGNWWHAATPAAVRSEFASFGFEALGEPVGVDHPRGGSLLTTPWYYYAFRLPPRPHP